MQDQEHLTPMEKDFILDNLTMLQDYIESSTVGDNGELCDWVADLCKEIRKVSTKCL